MKITILTLFPEMYEGFLNTSIIKKALLKKLVEIELVNFRDFSFLKSKRVDDYSYGGGSGMVLRYQPVVAAIQHYKTKDSFVVMLAPTGQLLNQNKVKNLSVKKHLILVCGHYEGYDERILTEIDSVVSIGDYILTGGELASMVISDAIIRLIPHVISEGSKTEESFENHLLEYPHYTRPNEISGLKVPEELLSGNHKLIEEYRLKESFKKTIINRPELISKYNFDKKSLEIYEKAIKELKKQSKLD